MGTPTARLGIIKPAYNEAADVATINAGWDVIDKTAGLILCTEAAKPTTNLFVGYYIKCIDSGKHYLNLTGLTTGWVEDTYGTSVIITLTGSGSVFYGARMTRPYIIGRANGDSAPSIDQTGSIAMYNTDGGIGTGVGRSFFAPNFSLTAATRGKIDFSAFVGTASATYVSPPTASHASGATWDLSSYVPIRFDLYDNGAFLCTVARAIPPLATTGDKFGETIVTETMISLATGNHAIDIRPFVEGTQQGLTSGAYLGIFEASFTVTLSA